MEKYKLLKYQTHQACLNYLKKRFDMLTQQFSNLQSSLLNETKSSAGDKHETGRAMVQLEIEKLGQQLKILKEMKITLGSINLTVQNSAVCLGSLVITTNENYYLGISAGKIELKDFSCYAISTASPIGKELLGKRVGDELSRDKAHVLIIQ